MKIRRLLSWMLIGVLLTAAMPGFSQKASAAGASLTVDQDYRMKDEFKLLDNENASDIGAVAAHHVFLDEYAPGGDHSYGYISTYNSWKYNASFDYADATLETLLPREGYPYDYDYAYVAYRVSASESSVIDTIEVTLCGYVFGANNGNRYEQLGVFLAPALNADANGKIDLKSMTCLAVYGTGAAEDFRTDKGAKTISVSSETASRALGSSRDAYIVVVPFISWSRESGNADTKSGSDSIRSRLGAIRITANEKAGAAETVPQQEQPAEPDISSSSLKVSVNYNKGENSPYVAVDDLTPEAANAFAVHHVFLDKGWDRGYLTTCNAWEYNPSVDYDGKNTEGFDGMRLTDPLPVEAYHYQYDYAYVVYRLQADGDRVIDDVSISINGYAGGINPDNNQANQIAVFLLNSFEPDETGRIALNGQKPVLVLGAGTAAENCMDAAKAKSVKVNAAELNGESRDVYVVVVPFIAWTSTSTSTLSGVDTGKARLIAINVEATQKSVATPGQNNSGTADAAVTVALIAAAAAGLVIQGQPGKRKEKKDC